MMDKEVTRKQFLLSILSIGALIVASRIPNVLKKKESKASYGNNAYGGTNEKSA